MSWFAHVWAVLAIVFVLWLAPADGHADETTQAEKPPVTQPQTAAAETKGGVAVLKTKSLEDLMNTEVTTVSRTESTVGQSPAAIFVITQEMIQRSGATTIAELFRMAPGMDVARIDNNKWAISSRGFNDRFVGKQLVQIDGRTVYNPINAGVYWDTLDYPLEDIERIEVIRGPGASLWGANAVNGIINIITKPAKDTQGGLVVAGGGNEERAFGEFRYGGKTSDDLHYRIYGKGFDRERQFSLEGDPNDQWWSARGGFRLDWQPSGPNSFTLQGEGFRSVAGRRDVRPTTNAPPYQFSNVEDEVTTGGNVLARWSHETDKDANWQLQAYWDRFERHAAHGIFAFDINTFDLDFQQQFPLGKRQKFNYGAGYRVNGIFFQGSRPLNNPNVNEAFAVGPGSVSRNPQLFSVFLQDQFTVVEERLFFTAGSKFEHNDFTGFEYQPTGRLLWSPTPRQSAWFAVSRAVKTPAITENDIQVGLLPLGTNFFRVMPNSSLGAEELLAYELGYRTQPARQVSFDLATFYNVYDNLIASVPQRKIPNDPTATTSTTPSVRQNRMNGETYGVELAANYRPTDWWRLYGAYTFLRMQLHREAPGISEAAEGQSPQNQVYLQSSWDLPRNVQFDLMGRYVDRLHGFNPSHLPGSADAIDAYFALDARLAWRPCKDIELSVVGQNLLDNHHPESGSNPLVRAPLVEIERSIYGKVTWQF